MDYELKNFCREHFEYKVQNFVKVRKVTGEIFDYFGIGINVIWENVSWANVTRTQDFQ